MSVYVIVQLTVHDRNRYDVYADALVATMTPHGGKVLVADDAPRVLEGEWSGNRVVMLEFPDRDAFRAWAGSPEYQAIVGDRHASSDAVITLVRSLPDAG
jgi:uncharacterized protein (DUF1330 family)